MPGWTAARIAQLIALLVASWCVMTLTHETGHILGGWCGGGSLEQVEFRPWRLPYSLFRPDPHPLLTLWSGPLLGIAIPVAVAWLLRREWLWFIASFCLAANGVYLAAAWFVGDRFLDTPAMLAHGASPLAIVGYCVVTIGIGYFRFRRSWIRLFG